MVRLYSPGQFLQTQIDSKAAAKRAEAGPGIETKLVAILSLRCPYSLVL